VKIYLIEVETDAGYCVVKRAPIEVDATADVMPMPFRKLTEILWNDARRGKSCMKISLIEVKTDAGRRVVKLAAPIEVDATAEVMPAHFRGLTEVLWNVVREVARQPPQVPKAEA
jgi:hypothetical protein